MSLLGPVVEPGPRRRPAEPQIVGSNPTRPAIFLRRVPLYLGSGMQETPRGNTPYDSVGTGFRLYGTVNIRDPHYPYCYSERSSELRALEKQVDAILRAARKRRERDFQFFRLCRFRQWAQVVTSFR